MVNIFQIILTVITTPVALLWIYLVRTGGETYEEVIKAINPEEYRYPDIFGVGFSLLKWTHFNLSSDQSVKRVKEIAEIRGKKYAPFYYYVMTGAKVTYAYSVGLIVLFLTILSNNAQCLVFGIILTGLLVWYIDELMKDKLEERRTQMIQDFPNILSKLTLLVNSGMVLRDAWKRTAKTGDTVLYQEMQKTVLEMENGVPELKAYQNFAERCELKEIKRFTSTVSQNILKGNEELSKFLREMSDEMWSEKKNLARQKGIAADSKLLFPTMLIFIGILILIMVPMMSGMNI